MKEEQPSSLEGAEAYGRMGKKAVHDFMEKFTKARPTIAASCDSTKLWTFPWVFGVCFAWPSPLVEKFVGGRHLVPRRRFSLWWIWWNSRSSKALAPDLLSRPSLDSNQRVKNNYRETYYIYIYSIYIYDWGKSTVRAFCCLKSPADFSCGIFVGRLTEQFAPLMFNNGLLAAPAARCS